MLGNTFRTAFAVAVLIGSEANAQQDLRITTLSAAGYKPEIAPGSVVTILGRNLAVSAVEAAPDGTLPQALNGTSVTFNGIAAGLIYASPGQINLIAPPDLAPGAATVVVNSPAAGAPLRGTVAVKLAAPGLFASCLRPDTAAPLGGIDYNLQPFAPISALYRGQDNKARIKLFATGLRQADLALLAAEATDTKGLMTALVDHSGRSDLGQLHGEQPGRAAERPAQSGDRNRGRFA
jgi:uncharacterized protein (TIGR03437 family)